jgi:hypothetical protein
MKTAAKGSASWACPLVTAFEVVILMAFTGHSARATDGSLLVVVEAPPALYADAAEIRRAIGTELHSKTLAPTKTPGEASDRALIIALDRDRIVMSLRGSDGTLVARVIPAPTDPAARLRAIAWLAGNLVRDQVGPIVAEAPPTPPSPSTIPALTATPEPTEPPPGPIAPAPAPTAPVPAPPPATPATPLTPAPLRRGGEVGETISIHLDERKPTSSTLWSISGAIGPVIADLQQPNGGIWPPSLGMMPSTAWQIEVQRRKQHGRLVVGGALEGTYNHEGNGTGPQLIGSNGFVGARWRYRYCSLETSVGAGIEAARIYQPEVIGTSANVTIDSYRIDLYAQGTLGAAVPLGGSLEGLLRLGIHITSSHDENWFAASTIGLRYTLR